MRVLILSDANSIHTKKWVTSLMEQGVEVGLMSLDRVQPGNRDAYLDVKLFELEDMTQGGEGSFSKWRYLKALPVLKKAIRSFKPDILHSHYASSYGLLGALSGFRPYIVSVWGADVFSFPKRSILHRSILKYNLRKADRILSTSAVMAQETRLYTSKDVTVTPFGVDLERFRPMEVDSPFSSGDIVVGTVKTLEPKYGIDYLVEAFSIVRSRHPELPLKLLIVGGGSREAELKEQAKGLGLNEHVRFTGQIDHAQVPSHLNMLDVAVFLSTVDSESFGVAVVEASSCGKPVVVSRVGGLPEVVEDGRTGTVVASKNAEAASEAIEELVLDEVKRREMGQNGRERVKEHYDWKENVAQMLGVYRSTLGRD